MIRNVFRGLVLLTALFVACDLDDDGTGPVVDDPVAMSLVVEPEHHLFDALGDSVRLSATVLDEDGMAIEGVAVAWTSGDPGVATVDDDGWVVAQAGGATWIVAKFEELADSAAVEVELDEEEEEEGEEEDEEDEDEEDPGTDPDPEVVVSVEIVPDSLEFHAIQDTTRLTAVVRDEDGEVVEGVAVVWASGDTTVATVDAEGLVVARGNGETEITASVGSAEEKVPVLVRQITAGLVISPAPAAVGEGDTLRLEAEFVDSNGVPIQSAAGKVIWSIADPSVATIDVDGLVEGGLRGGQTYVVGTYAELSDTVALRVMDQIAFKSANRVFVMNDDGSGVRQVSMDPAAERWAPEPPAWSPDGSQIAFMQLKLGASGDSASARSEADIHLVYADGTGEVVLTPRAGFDGYPTWAPKGDMIAFVSDRTEATNSDIFVMYLNGGDVSQITDSYDMEARPAWSPDGSWIAFASTVPQETTRLERIMPHGVGHLTLVEPGPTIARPVWSPDSEKILYAANANAMVDAPEVDSDIWVVNYDGTGHIQLTNDPASDINPAWSPDGSRIAFQSNRDGEYAIYVMNANGTGVVRLTDPLMSATEPAWSPDGNRIVFVGTKPGQIANLYIVNVDGGDPEPLLTADSNPAWVHAPVWRPRPRDW